MGGGTRLCGQRPPTIPQTHALGSNRSIFDVQPGHFGEVLAIARQDCQIAGQANAGDAQVHSPNPYALQAHLIEEVACVLVEWQYLRRGEIDKNLLKSLISAYHSLDVPSTRQVGIPALDLFVKAHD